MASSKDMAQVPGCPAGLACCKLKGGCISTCVLWGRAFASLLSQVILLLLFCSPYTSEIGHSSSRKPRWIECPWLRVSCLAELLGGLSGKD